MGDTVTIQIAASSCGGRAIVPVDMTWSTSDSSVVTVAPTTGVVRGLSAGEATIVGEDSGPYSVGPIRVVVRVNAR